MTAQKGSLLLIKVGDGASPETFSTIGGLRTTQMQLGNQALNADTLESGAWRTVLGGAGIHALSLSGSGLFTSTASEETVRGYGFAASVNNYQLIFANGDMISGAFIITSYSRSGAQDTEEMYALTLESAGTITFTAA